MRFRLFYDENAPSGGFPRRVVEDAHTQPLSTILCHPEGSLRPKDLNAMSAVGSITLSTHLPLRFFASLRMTYCGNELTPTV